MKPRVVLLLVAVVGLAFVAGLAMGIRRRGPEETPKAPPPEEPGLREPGEVEPMKESFRILPASPVKPATRASFERVLEALRSGDREAIRRALDELLARLRPEPLPAGENAATVYREAFKALVDPSQDVGVALAAGDQMTPEQRETLKVWLEANGRALELLHLAAGRSRCNFGIDYSKGLSVELPVKPLLAASKLLRAESLLAEGDASAEAARASYRLSEALAGEPLLVAQLVRTTCHGAGASAFERALQGGAGEEALEGIVGLLTPERIRDGFAAAMLGELYNSARFVVEPGAEEVLPAAEDPLRVVVLTDYAQMLSDYAGLLGRPYHEIRDDLDLLERTKRAGAQWYDQISVRTLQALGTAAESQSRAEATIGAARLGAALELYRKRNGAYPSTLAEVQSILPFLPADPFSGQPFRYRREGDGFVVYSVGADGNDDGGMWAEKDVVFRLNR